MIFTVSCIQFCNSSDMEANFILINNLVRQASRLSKLVLLPENCFLMPLNGRQLDSINYNMYTHPGITLCRKLAQELQVDILIGSVQVRPKPGGKLRNRLVYIGEDGDIIGYYDKMHLFDVVLSKEERYRESLRFDKGNRYKVVDTRFSKIGLSICYDIRFSYLFRKLMLSGAKVIAVPAAFTYTTGRKHWHTLIRARAIETGSFVIAPALCGTHDNSRITYGHSLIVAPDGEILAEGSENKDEIITATLDLREVDVFRKRMGI